MITITLTDDDAERVERALSNYIRDTRTLADQWDQRGDTTAAKALRAVCHALDAIANRIAETEDS